MLSARLGHFLDAPLGSIAKGIPFSPNSLTVIGFLITVIAAFVIPHNIRLGGVFILIGGAFDMLDGMVARAKGKTSKFGAFLDSVLDRYSDAFIFLSLSYYLAANGNHTGSFLSLGVLVGAFLISYARARAEGLGESCHTGIMERPERIISTYLCDPNRVDYAHIVGNVDPNALHRNPADFTRLDGDEKEILSRYTLS